MTWVIGRKLLNSKVYSKDGMLVGELDHFEIDVATWHVKAIKCEASRSILERLNLEEPSITGGRMVYVPTSEVDRVEDDVIHLKVDALELAKLRWHKSQTIV